MVVVSVAATLSRSFYTHVVWKYYWGPIAADAHGRRCLTVDAVQACGGYNIPNTLSWALLLGLLLFWAYRLLSELGETMDTELTISIVPYLLWGSVYHVLEDSDLFAPFGSVEPGSGFFDKYLGAFLITPLIWVEIVLVVVLVLVVGHWARRVAHTRGLGRGLQLFAYFLLALVALYVALWASQPHFVRFVAGPLVAFAAAALALAIAWLDVRRSRAMNPRTVVFATGMGFLLVGLYYVVVWQTDASDAWGLAALKGPGTEPKWWVLGALVVGVLLFTALVRALGSALSHPKTTTHEGEQRSASSHVAILIAVSILLGLVLLWSTLGACRLFDPADPGSGDRAANCYAAPIAPSNAAWAWAQLLVFPVLLFAVYKLVARWGQGSLGTRPQLAVFTQPVNLLMVAGQMTDAFMTSIGVDFFGYSEKHVLPTALIGLVEKLPAPFGTFATTLVMIPLKLLIVLAVVWLIDMSAREEGAQRENLVGLIKLAILMVGLSPGVRNAVRVAMVT